MPTLKGILIKQAAIPINLENSIPLLPKISQFMTQIAAAIPVDPALPDIPLISGIAPSFPMVEGFNQVIKGIEDAIPMAPKLSEGIQGLAMGGFRPIEKKEGPQPRYRVLGGGYRSIG